MTKREIEAIGEIENSEAKKVDSKKKRTKAVAPLLLSKEQEDDLKARKYLSKKYFTLKYLHWAFWSPPASNSPEMEELQKALREWIDRNELCLRFCQYHSLVERQFGGKMKYHVANYMRGDIEIGFIKVPATYDEYLAQVKAILPVKGEYAGGEDYPKTATTTEFDIILGVYQGFGTAPDPIFLEEYPVAFDCNTKVELQFAKLERK
jgi:hypothetical protein